MFNPLKMLGDINAMRKQAGSIQAALSKEEFEVVVGRARVVVNGNQEVKTVEIDGEYQEDLKRAMNDAIKKAQHAAAAKLMEMSKGMEGQ